MQNKLLLGVIMLVGLLAYSVTLSGVAYAQGTSIVAVSDSLGSLAIAIGAAASAIAGIIGLFIPYMKGMMKDKAILVKDSLVQTDYWAKEIEARLKREAPRLEMLEEIIINLSKANPEALKVYEEYKGKIKKGSDTVEAEISKDTAELEKAHDTLTEMIKK